MHWQNLLLHTSSQLTAPFAPRSHQYVGLPYLPYGFVSPAQVKKQAADLRYIMEAPKMELSPEERVTIPLLNTEDSWVKKG